MGHLRAFAASVMCIATLAACAAQPDRAADVAGSPSAGPERTTTMQTPADASGVPQTSSSRPDTRATATPAGARAPDFTLRTLDGDTFTLSDHFGQLPVVLNFWAPW